LEAVVVLVVFVAFFAAGVLAALVAFFSAAA